MKGKFGENLSVCIFLSLLILFGQCQRANAQTKNAELFTYDELKTLYESKPLTPVLQLKLDALRHTPFVGNDYQTSDAPRFSQSPALGEFLRVAEWNIERGLEFEAIAAAFGEAEKFAAMLDEKRFPFDSPERRAMLEQSAALRKADVIILNEVDWGLKRSEYHNIAAELAARLKMNYAFGIEFVELSPVHLSQRKEGTTAQEKELNEAIKVDPARYKGMHGIAILSRFPLENVRLVPFKNQPYDWFQQEKNGASLLEKGRRKLSEKFFLEETLREVRRGGRAMLLADITDPKFPDGRVTIAATHLENRTKSKNRLIQLKELLAAIRNVSHPVVLAGDMNTSSADLTPTSLRRELVKRLGKPGFWIRKGVSYALGFGFIEDTLLDGVTFWRKQSDPTVRHIPFLMPNSERRFFTTLKDFRFADGGAFDFRGEKEISYNDKKGTLANSNERGSKGFVNTYQVNRPVTFVGKSKLDWFFIKPAELKNPTAEQGNYRFAPHFGRTLEEVNRLFPERISDHRPMIVDLPLAEPPRNP